MVRGETMRRVPGLVLVNTALYRSTLEAGAALDAGTATLADCAQTVTHREVRQPPHHRPLRWRLHPRPRRARWMVSQKIGRRHAGMG